VATVEESAKPQYATYRILLRGLFAGVREAKFSPASHELGLFICHALLTLIESIVSHAAPPSAPSDVASAAQPPAAFGDASATMLRGLFAHLFALFASGAAKPLSSLFYVVYRSPSELPLPKAEIEWEWLLRMRMALPHTAWEMTYIDANCRKVLVRALRRAVDPLTEPLRNQVPLTHPASPASRIAALAAHPLKPGPAFRTRIPHPHFARWPPQVKEMKRADMEGRLKRRNDELEWFALVANVVSRNLRAAKEDGKPPLPKTTVDSPMISREQAYVTSASGPTHPASERRCA
jgi:hypothetical protein